MDRRIRTAASYGVGAVVIVAVIAIALTCGADEPELFYRTLDYDVAIQGDGDVAITQTIDMKLNARGNDERWRQLYQQYTLDSAQVTNISGISVTDLDSGEEYTQIAPQSPSGISYEEWDDDYAGHWYIADVSEGDDDPLPFDPQTDGLPVTVPGERAATKQVEVGWNIPATTSAESRRFAVTMVFENLVTDYADVAKFMWEPVAKANRIPVGMLTGTVRFPQAADDDDSWGFLHYEGVSQTHRGPEGELEFTADDVKSGDYVDLLVMFDKTMAPDTARQASTATKQATLDEENEAESQWRRQQRDAVVRNVLIWITMTLVAVLLSVLAIRRAWKGLRLQRAPKDSGYWRSAPDFSPAAAAALNGFTDGADQGDVHSRQLSATLMYLANCRLIAIYPGPARLYAGFNLAHPDAASLARMIGADSANKDTVQATSTIVVLPGAFDAGCHEGLDGPACAALDFLKAASQSFGCPVFDLEMLNQSAAKGGWKGPLVPKLNKFYNESEEAFKELHATKSYGYNGWATVEVLVAIASFVYALVIQNLWLAAVTALPMMFCSVFAVMLTPDTVLSEAGDACSRQLQGLKNYLEDFSDFSDRGPLDLARWGEYLVYATALGISGEAMRQLARAYPQMADAQWLDAHAQEESLVYWSMREELLWKRDPDDRHRMRSGYRSAARVGAGAPVGASAFDGSLASLGKNLHATYIASVREPSSSSSSGSSGSFSSSSGGYGGSSGGGGGGSFGGR